MDSDKTLLSRTIGWALESGWKVVAAVRGMAFTQDKDITYYIDVVAESPDQKEQYDIGFWPGVNKDYSITEKDLTEIQCLHPTVQIERGIKHKRCNLHDRSDFIDVTNG